jgi:hypothetical protein
MKNLPPRSNYLSINRKLLSQHSRSSAGMSNILCYFSRVVRAGGSRC